MKELKILYENKKDEIKQRLREFKEVMKRADEAVFSELVFCLLTPQSKAIEADKAVKLMGRTGVLWKSDANVISRYLNKIRFPENKARYIQSARGMFTQDDRIVIKKKIASFSNVFEAREWLAKSIKGLGMKESSHFLRNIGLGSNIAILDRHVLKNLAQYGVIEEIPNSLTEKKYLEIEDKMREFAERLGISMDELDLLLWSKETGEVFK